MHEESILYKKGFIPTRYDKDDLEGILNNSHFDFISIDGPIGSYSKKSYNRMDLIPFLPQILSDDFVIIVDDYDRYGERNMVEEIEAILRKNGIKYASMSFLGENDVYVIASEKRKYLVTV